MKLLATTHGAAADPRTGSEDAFRYQERGDSVIAALADGLGSSKEGAVASRRAVDMITDYYLTRPQTWSPRRALTEFASQINRIFFQESSLRHGSPELLCTLTVAVIEGDQLYGLNVGDSPLFLWRGGVLTRLSENHALSETGLEHVLTRAVGLKPALEPYLFETTIENGDLLLLCSDGVSAAVPEAKLKDLLERHASARSFVATAREISDANPEFLDDATAIVVEIAERGWRGGTASRPLEVVGNLHAKETIDDYRLVRSLQESDRVWLAERADGIKHVLKFPALEARDDEARRDAFVREMWQATRLDSPDFVQAFTPAGGVLRYYGMDYIDAPTLREVLKQGPLAVEEVVSLGKFLLRACQFLLQRDYAHGDLKPDNLLVIRNPSGLRFQLLDLGTAAEVFSVTSRAGTPSYLAPERFHGGALSERTEIFSIGVTLYEALTRTYPYGEIERFQTPRFETTPRLPSRSNPAVPPWLDSVLLRALSAATSSRYQNFSEMTYDLEHPETVSPYHRKDAPLLERNPLLAYKLLSLFLFILNVLWLVAWRARK